MNQQTKPIRTIEFTQKHITHIDPQWDMNDMIDDVDIEVPSDGDFTALDDELLDDEGNITNAGWDALSAMDSNGEFV
jgi:hypothetical protein